MSDKKRVRFIINPISGGKSKGFIPELVQQKIDKEQFEPEFAFTESADHTSFLAQECVQNNYDIAVAVGGDGTVNQIASELVNSRTALGIVPFGSGNGLARAFGISMQSAKAIIGLNQSKIIQIDCGSANDSYFFNVCGFGFDAHVSAAFAQAGSRGFKTYAKESLRAIRSFKSEEIWVERVLEKEREKEKEVYREKYSAFILAICNGPQYGNNAYISPPALLHDGEFNMSVIENVNWLNFIGLGSKLFLKNLHLSKHVKTALVKDMWVRRAKDNFVNIDGEAIWFPKDVKITMHPLSLNVVIPV